MIDRLIAEISKKACPVCVGLDTTLERMPPQLHRGKDSSFAEAAAALLKYNRLLLDSIADLVPSVKIQCACYEMYGTAGVEAFAETVRLARAKGLIVIADAKRSDIGASAACYADAFIGRTPLADGVQPVFDADFVTVNPYLGSDGIDPFLQACRDYDRGIFVLVKTSNPSSRELQDLRLENGRLVYEQMMEYVAQYGRDLIGDSGYSEVGAVVGATHPAQAAALRAEHPAVFLLLPGVGAQGAKVQDLTSCFDHRGTGAIINVSRSVLQAWQMHPDLDPAEAARRSVETLRTEILEAFAQEDIEYAQ